MVILNDPTHTDYDEIDLKLIKALALKKSWMSGNFPVWIDRSDRVTFEARAFVSKSQAAIQRKQHAAEQAQQKGGSPKFGTMYYAVPKLNDGGPWPTMREFLEQEAEKKGDKPFGRPGN